MNTLSRRRFLSALGTGLGSLPLITIPEFVAAQRRTLPHGKTLVLIELAGGNDGLNTVIPITDTAYRGLRPEIGIATADGLRLDDDTALHGAMRACADLWEEGALRIVEGVGYPNPNRSHFRSIEIWNAGQGADSLARDGWIASAFADGRAPQKADVSGLVLGGEMGPLSGEGRFSAMRDEDVFLETIENLPGMRHAIRPNEVKSPLEHVLRTYESAQVTGDLIVRKLERSAARRFDFPRSELGSQLRTAARLLDAGVDVPVLKVVQGGYDTHDNQPDEHAFLLGDLSASLGAFADALRQIGLWDDVTIVTYSEFGRTARENGSYGTDHGTAAPVFVAGGHVAGGFGGRRVALDRLVDDDLVHTTDYRHLYAGLLHDLWGISSPEASQAIRLHRVD
ncbi:DUF1501 domain-containing protein [Yoonia sp. GPGPB17]|uniref:DUF1501 domain-containing protein n=1 Tax=Yoonia sp. GPGPB17 TaxID=3026147 RepID=UPI0030BBDFF1